MTVTRAVAAWPDPQAEYAGHAPAGTLPGLGLASAGLAALVR